DAGCCIASVVGRQRCRGTPVGRPSLPWPSRGHSVVRVLAAGAAAVAAAGLLITRTPARRVVQLPAGVVEVQKTLRFGSDVEVYGSPRGTTLSMSAPFDAAALIDAGDNAYLHDLATGGHHEPLLIPSGLPVSHQTF